MTDLSKRILLQGVYLSKGNNRSNRKYQDEISSLIKVLKESDDSIFFDSFHTVVKSEVVKRILYDKMYVTSLDGLQIWSVENAKCDFASELRWQLTLLKANARDINSILSEKKEVEKAIFNNDYVKASAIMDEVVSLYGYSFWALDVYVNIYKKLSPDRIQDVTQHTHSKIVRTLLFYWNLRATETYQFTSYCNYCKKQIDILDSQSSVRDYLTHILIPGNLPPTIETIYSLMGYLRYLPYLDRYFLIIEIFQRILLEGKSFAEAVDVERYLFLLDEIHDDVLDVIRFFTDDIVARREYEVNDDLSMIKSIYISGDSKKAKNVLEEYIMSNHYSIEAMILGMFIDVDYFRNYYQSIGREDIYSCLYEVLTFSDQNGESKDKLLRFAYCNAYSQWGKDLYNFIILADEAYNSDEYKYTRRFCYRNCLSDSMVFSILPMDEIIDYYKNYEDQNQYVVLRLSILKNDFGKVMEYTHNSHILKMIGLLNCSEKLNGIDLIDKNPLITYENFRLFWHSLSKTNFSPVPHFVQHYIKNREVCGMFPFEVFFELFERNYFEKESLSVPIICYAYTTKYIDEHREMELVNACDDFFRAFHVDKPSELNIEDFSDKKEEFVFFLKNVCVPEIMKKVLISINSARMLEIERIHILEILKVIDEYNIVEYADEINRRYQQMAINLRVSQVNKGRIYVNTNGLKSYLMKELKDDYEAYLLSQDERIETALKQIKERKFGDNVEVIVLDPKEIMYRMIQTIRDAFAFNEAFGLDTYLSINIRHGMLDEKIRAPLALHGLAVPYKDEKRKEKINQQWFKAISDFKNSEIVDAIYSLNEGVGKICEELLKDVIRITTEKRGTKGVFDLSLYENHRKRLNARLWAINSLEDIIDIVISFLWDETELALNKIRKTILPQKQSKLNELLNDFRRVYNNKKVYTTQLKMINLMSDEFAGCINQIEDWFTHSNDTEVPDYSLEEVLLDSLNVIEELHPEVKIMLSCDYSYTQEYKMTSRMTYIIYVTIFHNLLGNAVSYGKKNNNILDISYGLRCSENEVDIFVKNDIVENQIDYIDRKMNEIKQIVDDEKYRANVGTEGGTGLKKACVMIESSLGYTPEFDFALDKENNALGIHIKGSK